MLRIYYFDWACKKCQSKPAAIEIGVSSEMKLVAMWTCAKCKTICSQEVPLSEVIAKVPKEKIA